MNLKIYDTLTREKTAFEPIRPGKVRMYVCGPTVYDKAHVGHAMSSLVFDVVRRYLEYKGYDVTHIMNYTDVDDKVIRRANELGIEPTDLAERYIRNTTVTCETSVSSPLMSTPAYLEKWSRSSRSSRA